MTLDKYEIYCLTDLKLARSLDFRPDGMIIKGIILVLLSSASNWRNYQQWLGRVGRHGDPCIRIRVSSEIDTQSNLSYVSALRKALDTKTKDIIALSESAK